MSIDPKIFNKKYYLDTCFGSEEFKKSGGVGLHPRVKDMINRFPIHSDMSVLEIGCGRGDTAMHVAKKAKSVVAIDYSSDAIKIANSIKKKYSKKIQDKVIFKVISATEISFPDNRFDLILLIDTIDHLSSSEQNILFLKIRKVLKSGGILFVRTCSNKILLSKTYPIYTYPMNQLVTWVDKKIKGVSYDSLPKDPRITDEKIQHINESDYYSLQKLFSKYSFSGSIRGETGLVKEGNGMRTALYNFLIGLYPLSKYYPLNIFFANSFICTMRLTKP